MLAGDSPVSASPAFLDLGGLADATLLCSLGLLWESMIAALGVGALPNRRRNLWCKVAWILSQVPSMRQALK